MSLIPITDVGQEQLTTLFRLLGDRTRLNIVLLLAEGEKNVTELCSAMSLPQPTVSHHLGLLRMHEVIANRRNGKQIFYALSGPVDVGSKRELRIDVGMFKLILTNRSSTLPVQSLN